jgi:predicted DNA-binding transcriptional regulator AlpA
MDSRVSATVDDGAEDRLLRAADVQAQLNMSRAKVYRLMQYNILPPCASVGRFASPERHSSSGSRRTRRRVAARAIANDNYLLILR